MIRVTENSSVQERLAPEDLRFLLPLVRGSPSADRAVFRSITPTERSDEYILSPGSFVGRLGLPSGRWIEIESRFPFEDVVDLIRLSARTPVRWDTMAVAMDRSRFIIDVVASAFVREVERIIGKGIAKSYVERRFQEPPLPGRIDTAYHLGRWAGRPDKLATVAKRLTVDIPVNQAITIAARILRRAPLPLDLSSRLARIASCFRKVSHPPMSGEVVAAIRLSRLTSHYREALSLSEVIIRGDSIAPRHAVHSGTSIAFYMPKVWEDCVTRWVRSEWDPTFVCEPSYSFALTNGGEVSSLADVVVRDSSGIVALYDAKYKWPDATPSSEDIYQMVTYCERLRLTKATLCYPVHIEPRSVHVGNRTVNMVGLRQVRDSLKMIGLRAAAS